MQHLNVKTENGWFPWTGSYAVMLTVSALITLALPPTDTVHGTGDDRLRQRSRQRLGSLDPMEGEFRAHH